MAEIRDRDFNEQVGLPFPCLIQKLCEFAGIPVSKYYDRHTTVKKSTNAALIKDMDNPVYKTKVAWPVMHVPMTTVPPPSTLSLEGATTVPPTDEATEKPEGNIRPTPSTTAATGMMIIVPYAFLERLVQD